jgi:hypothetical protein
MGNSILIRPLRCKGSVLFLALQMKHTSRHIITSVQHEVKPPTLYRKCKRKPFVRYQTLRTVPRRSSCQYRFTLLINFSDFSVSQYQLRAFHIKLIYCPYVSSHIDYTATRQFIAGLLIYFLTFFLTFSILFTASG